MLDDTLSCNRSIFVFVRRLMLDPSMIQPATRKTSNNVWAARGLLVVHLLSSFHRHLGHLCQRLSILRQAESIVAHSTKWVIPSNPACALVSATDCDIRHVCFAAWMSCTTQCAATLYHANVQQMRTGLRAPCQSSLFCQSDALLVCLFLSAAFLDQTRDIAQPHPLYHQL